MALFVAAITIGIEDGVWCVASSYSPDAFNPNYCPDGTEQVVEPRNGLLLDRGTLGALRGRIEDVAWGVGHLLRAGSLLAEIDELAAVPVTDTGDVAK
jgi:hypothetical protein